MQPLLAFIKWLLGYLNNQNWQEDFTVGVARRTGDTHSSRVHYIFPSWIRSCPSFSILFPELVLLLWYWLCLMGVNDRGHVGYDEAICFYPNWCLCHWVWPHCFIGYGYACFVIQFHISNIMICFSVAKPFIFIYINVCCVDSFHNIHQINVKMKSL